MAVVAAAGAAAKVREKKREWENGAEGDEEEEKEEEKDFLVEDQRERRMGPAMIWLSASYDDVDAATPWKGF